jgi:hypothetical protein
MVIVYKPTQKGIEFCRSVLEPYERIFPRNKDSVDLDTITNNTSNNNDNNNNLSGKQVIKSSHQKQVDGEQKEHTELPLITP